MPTIKSILFFLFAGFSLTACTSTTENTYKAALTNDYVGEIQPTELQKKFPIFNENYQAFTVTNEQKALIETWPSSLNIDIYFGTWCHDSIREVPKLLKVLSYTDKVNSHLYSLDRTKKDPDGKAQSADIKYTPTMVISMDGKEIGRIIENPKSDWVTDINTLINP